jgi:hypothetical protein
VRAVAQYSPVDHLPVLHVDDASRSKFTPLPAAKATGSMRELHMKKSQKSSNHASSCSPQKSAGYSRVGLLAWRWQGKPARRFTFPSHRPSGTFKAAILTYSGGTAPALHRTSLLCLDGHPRQISLYHNEIVGMSGSRRLENLPKQNSH